VLNRYRGCWIVDGFMSCLCCFVEVVGIAVDVEAIEGGG
jgi:hypothetical protein